MHYIRRFAQLSGGDRLLLLRAYCWILWVYLRLKFQGFRETAMHVPPYSEQLDRSVPGEVLDHAQRYARFIALAARYHVVSAQCLQRALVLHYWLRHDGIPSELRIGVRKEAGELKAHAWVEVAGRLVNEHPASVAAFTPLSGIADPDGSPARSWILASGAVPRD